MNDSSDWEIQKNTIFQDTIFDLYTLPQLICTQTLLKHIRARCNKICQRKEKDGIYPPLAIFCRSCFFFFVREREISAFLHVWQEIPTLQILPLLSVVLGPRTSDLSLLPYFLHLYNEDKDTCRCYMVSVTIH